MNTPSQPSPGRTTGGDPQPIIEVHNLNKRFGDLVVFDDFSMEVYPGENVVVMGRSGSGKTVLIKCIVGLIKPDSGDLQVFGKDIARISKRELDELRRRIGFVFQQSALYDSMTVRKNLEFPLRWQVHDKKELENLVKETLRDVGLEHTYNLMPAELSGGMSKRIGIARSIIQRPEILLYDEPTTGLDPITAEEITDLMKELQTQYQSASIVITHDIHLAKAIGNRIIFLVEGKAYAQGTFDELAKTTDPKIKPFFKQL